MTSSDGWPPAFQDVAAAFAEYLDRIESGEALSFSEFCATKAADLQVPLRRVFDDWKCIETVRGTDTPNSSTFADLLRAERRAQGIDEFSLDTNPEASEGPAWNDLIDRLGATRREEDRYLYKGEVARGGMGAIVKVWDQHLRRALAKKVLLSADERGTAARDATSEDRMVGRFLEEAQVSAQLEHPGIVPVHELGVDRLGKLYFTMQLVEGRDLRALFVDVASGAGGWSLTRALGVILRVCEATAYAHSKGVVHRDLKPSNIMVGRFGETYVMDWGLARVLRRDGESVGAGDSEPSGVGDGRDADRDGDQDADLGETSRVMTERQERGEALPDSPLNTMEGDVVGTPAYMSPEQARGEMDLVGPASDVYSVGAILYELLAGRMPYTSRLETPTPQDIWRRVLAGPPEPLARIDRDIPPPLVAICERSMAREPSRRYASMETMADDLRAYLENRVVRAYRTGPVAEFKSWVQRNRPFAVALAALVVVVLGAGSLYALAQRDAARSAARLAEERASGAAAELIAQAEASWPVHPDHAEAMADWIGRAEALVASLPDDLEQKLAHLRRSARPYSDEDARRDRRSHPDRIALDLARNMRKEFAQQLQDARSLEEAARQPDWMQHWAERVVDIRPLPEERTRGEELARLASLSSAEWWMQWVRQARAILPAEIEALDARIERLSGQVEKRRTWPFDDSEIQEQHDFLATLAGHALRLERDGGGLIDEVSRRRDRSLALVTESVDAHRELWRTAIASIADAEASPLYGGLVIGEQIGLLPLRQDPHTGLWEFQHVLSGEAPVFDRAGDLRVTPETGLVLVLVPGGEAVMGAQSDPAKPYYDPGASGSERPVQSPGVLDPFFLAKHELTQAQWTRLAGRNPSEFFAARDPMWSARVTRTHPVENVSWEESAARLALWSLVLPTEAQWEYAARAGTDTVRWWGDAIEAGVEAANFQDRAFERARDLGPATMPWDDGWAVHAPVDTKRPNAWGFHHMLGNVSEWCADWYGSYAESEFATDGTGLIEPEYWWNRSFRGGGFGESPHTLRVAQRYSLGPDKRYGTLGVRPARPLDR